MEIDKDITTNKIYNECCLKTMERMEDNFIDVVVTSPPYNIGLSRINGGFNKKQYSNYSDNLEKDEYFKQTKIWIDELLRVTKHHVFYNIQELTGNRGIVSFITNEYKDHLKETFIWAKPNPPSPIVDTMVSSGFEYIFCFSKDNPQKRSFTYCNFSQRSGDYVGNCIIKPVNSGRENKGHSFAFGDWLPGYFINHFSKEGDLIYDPFMGTGTTAKSSHIYKRNWIGSEISPEYLKIAEKRIKVYTDQQTLF